MKAFAAPSDAALQADQAGGGGALRILLWQAPTLLNPHFANGTKDPIASRIFFEPLAGWDKDGNLIPLLAAEVPTERMAASRRWHDA